MSLHETDKGLTLKLNYVIARKLYDAQEHLSNAKAAIEEFTGDRSRQTEDNLLDRLDKIVAYYSRSEASEESKQSFYDKAAALEQLSRIVRVQTNDFVRRITCEEEQMQSAETVSL